ncbi:HprK-related kinase A [uncultured Thiohalocapsa sp.]|mgnify:CR=1 FL=1|uniref:HprK-related kinase A n=1 Tax=uncultured Thiohalocapsa sp. TaxID=768990 RepID=UPI0025D835AE|nr:HprK-related kinase A [uncultured Thiohalocapsa sp.]
MNNAFARAPQRVGVRPPRAPAIYRHGPFTVRVTTPLRRLRALLSWCYGDSEPDAGTVLVHFDLQVRQGPLLRRLFSPQAIFRTDTATPFAPFPRSHAFPLLEWGLNWCVATRAHQFLMLHAGVLERDGYALVLPAVPGSGKSTLTAALALRGWRLLSDEFGLLDWRTGLLMPLPRAIPLKNRSIRVIRDFAPEAELGPVFPKTRKGDVAHLRPPAESRRRQHESAQPAWIVFPRYVRNSPLQLAGLHDSTAFTRLSQNAFNYRLLGATGFDALTQLVRSCRCWSAQFGDLNAMITAIDHLPVPEM